MLKRVNISYKPRSLGAIALTIVALATAPMFALAENSPPDIKPNTVALPVFKLKDGRELSAGKIFAVQLADGKIILLSCAHLFSAMGGLDRTVSNDELTTFCKGVDIASLDGSKVIGKAGRELLTNGRPSNFNPIDCRGDLVAFMSFKSPLAPIAAIQTEPAKAGSHVWLITKEVTAPGDEQQIIGGEVTEIGEKYLEVKMDRDIKVQATSGSPVVDQTGKLIGMLIGGSAHTIILHPATSILAQLKEGLPEDADAGSKKKRSH